MFLQRQLARCGARRTGSSFRDAFRAQRSGDAQPAAAVIPSRRNRQPNAGLRESVRQALSSILTLLTPLLKKVLRCLQCPRGWPASQPLACAAAITPPPRCDLPCYCCAAAVQALLNEHVQRQEGGEDGEAEDEGGEGEEEGCLGADARLLQRRSR